LILELAIELVLVGEGQFAQVKERAFEEEVLGWTLD
jgi:hypothetical protein